MASGDAQRVWFPEMVGRLRSQWHQGMSLDAIVELSGELEAMLQQIRSERSIRSAAFRCSRCGYVGEGADPHVGFAELPRFHVAFLNESVPQIAYPCAGRLSVRRRIAKQRLRTNQFPQRPCLERATPRGVRSIAIGDFGKMSQSGDLQALE